MSQKKPAIFLDRDGTICQEVGYLRKIEDLKLIDRSIQAIQKINQHKWLTIIVSNQSGVARGYMDEETVEEINIELVKLLKKHQARIDGIYYCPHHPQGNPPYRMNCSCRKPSPGMILRATKEFNIDLNHSVIMGDKYTDILTAHKLNIPGILILTGYGKEEYQKHKDKWEKSPYYIANNLYEAVEWWFKKVSFEK